MSCFPDFGVREARVRRRQPSAAFALLVEALRYKS